MIVNGLHKFIRQKQLSETISEFIIDKGNIKPNIGLILSELTAVDRFYLASGMQEVWLRFLYRNDESNISFDSFKPNSAFVLKGDITSSYPDIADINSDNSIFIAQDIGIANCLSYFSSYPSKKIHQLFYITKEENAVNKEWLIENQNTIIADDITDELIIDATKKYYVMGHSEWCLKINMYLKSKEIHPANITLIKDYY